MNIKIVCVGRLKEKFYQDALKEFEKRLSRYCKLSIIEVPDEKAPEQLSEAGKLQVLAKEGERILDKIDDDEVVAALCIEGKQMPSEKLAKTIADWGLSGKSRAAFIIGGSLGLSEAVKKRAQLRLSFSEMTFSHQIFRVMLLEQIYRACKINAGEPYHK